MGAPGGSLDARCQEVAPDISRVGHPVLLEHVAFGGSQSSSATPHMVRVPRQAVPAGWCWWCPASGPCVLAQCHPVLCVRLEELHHGIGGEVPRGAEGEVPEQQWCTWEGHVVSDLKAAPSHCAEALQELQVRVENASLVVHEDEAQGAAAEALQGPRQHIADLPDTHLDNPRDTGEVDKVPRDASMHGIHLDGHDAGRGRPRPMA
mmetsp:Transcript_64003/g.137679  ORF Transcript_64003/g.137679 Transcript_64003/m.137679 type:complete len:206 (-) Transcript_64003:754-1371(-)